MCRQGDRWIAAEGGRRPQARRTVLRAGHISIGVMGFSLSALDWATELFQERRMESEVSDALESLLNDEASSRRL
jgi:hypothetical protein